jgi:hypothetical protein
MDKSDLFKHALNIADFMQAVSSYLTQGQWDEETEVRKRFAETPDQFHNRHDEFGDPIELGDIGLDDMSLQRIVIELSQDRRNFKVWTPFNEEFIASLKSDIPKHSRSWDPDERCWRVDCYWFGNLQDLLPEHFEGLERYYTQRAIRMIEQLAREDDEEERLERERKQRRKQKKKKKPKAKAKKRQRRTSKAKEKYRNWQDAPPDEEEDGFDWDPEPSGPDPYTVLGVKRDAPDEVIKAAHKVLARKYHTDATGGDGDDSKMKEINAAFEQIKEMRKWTTK